MYKFTKFLKSVVIVILLLLPFFHKPRWCLDQFEEGTSDFDSCGFKPEGVNHYKKFMYDGEETDVEDVGIPSS